MKKLSIFETSILGLFLGVIIATYLTFIISTEGYIGSIISLISLRPILELIPLTTDSALYVSFAFFVFVYLIYGLILGIIIHYINKPKLITLPIIIILGSVMFEGFTNYSKQISDRSNPKSYSIATVINSIPKVPKQYFGNEATGDLNGDNIDDIAFLIHRNDKDRGVLYYLTTALSTSTGRVGTNLIFLGEKIIPQDISIEDGLITINYSTDKSTTTKQQFAHLKDGNLEKTTKIIAEEASTTDKTSTSI